MKKPLIEFVEFGFQYHSQSEPTLLELNCTIYEGEKVLIVGPSGSGKSSFAHCINGLIPFYYSGEMTGSLKIRGKELRELNLTQISDLVGTVLQDPDGQFVGLTVAEDIAFKLENDGIPQLEMRQKVAASALRVGMENHLDQAPHVLSGGQKQRTTLAGVLVNDVEILLFDEPLANLDPRTGKSAIELIDEIHQDTQKTIIIIEHRLEEVLHRGIDRIIVMYEGRIIADLTPNELLCSSLLRQIGIREPLYLSALRYAGCEITPEMKPCHIESIILDPCKFQLHEWIKNRNQPSASQETQALLELRHIHFRYDEHKEILHDVSFTLHEGEMVCIVGMNGAGKSTVSKLICGFYKPTSGQMLLKNKDMLSMTIRERAEHIGYVLQNPNQMISQTLIFDEVAFGLKIRGVPESQVKERVYDVLKVCGLYAFRNWPISALSFGQKKRVTIASILVLNPQILILDEPTAGQDFKHYNEMMEFILQLNRQGVTIIMITHDMHLMLEYAERAIVLAEGRRIADDCPANVLTDAHIIEAAHLKETSLDRLAVRAGLDQPIDLLLTFIDEDRRKRN